MGPQMYYSVLGIPNLLKLISEAECICRRAEDLATVNSGCFPSGVRFTLIPAPLDRSYLIGYALDQ
jgi:hypothetical protein